MSNQTEGSDGSGGVTARVQDQHCPHCGGVKSGWVIYDRVGPNLPQRSITFRCPECKKMLSKGVVYWYDDRDADQEGEE